MLSAWDFYYFYVWKRKQSKISKIEISSDLAIAIFFPSSLIITFESHIRNPTYTFVSKRPINHRDTRINVSYRPRSGNVIIWKLMASGLLGPSGGCMRVGSLRWIFIPNAQRIYRERDWGSINLGRRTANLVVIHE